ncbi:FtsH protease activity modulator HflK [candidate division KSB1 bacterium]|nr:FtsH protease activity modulator HflK [candidate division KSB1 bacterium]
MNRRTIDIGGEQVQIPDVSPKFIFRVVLGIVVILILFSSFYTVGTDQVGVLQRFGAYHRTTEPGLHFKLPWGIEAVTKVKVQRVFKEEFGFRTVSAGVRTEYSSRDYTSESLMLTGDLNSALVEWIVQYRIKDPVNYLFRVRHVEGTIRDVSESVMRQVAGDHSVDEVIILRRKEIAQKAQELAQALLDEYETGIDIVTVNLQDVNPPVPVQPAFNEVNEARQEKERIINEAWKAYNTAIPKARGQAEQVVLQAEGYATNRINRARGDADRFLSLWQEYRKAKDVTKRRLYLETMLEILPKIKTKVIVDDELGSFLPLLHLEGKGVGR